VEAVLTEGFYRQPLNQSRANGVTMAESKQCNLHRASRGGLRPYGCLINISTNVSR
jgi:hypothetical protein